MLKPAHNIRNRGSPVERASARRARRVRVDDAREKAPVGVSFVVRSVVGQRQRRRQAGELVRPVVELPDAGVARHEGALPIGEIGEVSGRRRVRNAPEQIGRDQLMNGQQYGCSVDDNVAEPQQQYGRVPFAIMRQRDKRTALGVVESISDRARGGLRLGWRPTGRIDPIDAESLDRQHARADLAISLAERPAQCGIGFEHGTIGCGETCVVQRRLQPDGVGQRPEAASHVLATKAATEADRPGLTGGRPEFGAVHRSPAGGLRPAVTARQRETAIHTPMLARSPR